MSVKWIKDTDTGELYPIKDDFEFETPAHLETPDYNIVDYDKTREMTIEQLQNQLIAAQNHIEAIKNEKTSDNNSEVTVNDVSPEIVSRSEKRLNADVAYNGKSKSFDFFAILKYVSVVLLLCIVSAIGIYVFSQENGIDISFTNSSENNSSDYEISPIPEIGSIPVYSGDYGVSLYLNEKDKEPQEQQEQQETEQEQSESGIKKSLSYLLSKLLLIFSVLCGFKIGIGLVIKIVKGT